MLDNVLLLAVLAVLILLLLALLYLRHPGSLPSLRSRLSILLGLHESSLRVSAEVSRADARLPPLAERPRMLTIRVDGRPIATFFDALFDGLVLVVLVW